MHTTLIIFLLVYVALGFGKLPGFLLDRTGAAVVGALAMLAFGSISSQAAWAAIDYRTVGLLFGLMVVSGAFGVSGFYDWAARKVATLPVSPPVLLAVLIAVGGLMSALLTNDVIVVAMTPLLVSLTLARGLNPIPFLLAFCFAANAVASATVIGSPQNMIVAQGLDLSFNRFLSIAAVPSLLTMPIIWAVVVWLYHGRWKVAPNAGPAPANASASVVPLDKEEAWKAALVTLGVILAFVLSDWPRELIALTAAGFLLINRRVASSDVLKQVDGNLLLLIMGLFVVNAAMATTGLPQTLLQDLRGLGIDLNEPLALFFVGGLLSNIVGNSPAVMVLTPYFEHSQHVDSLGAALVLGTGFSSNLIIFGSLAGIIVVEQAAACGVKISFKEFMRAGFPVTAVCMVMAAVWIVLIGR